MYVKELDLGCARHKEDERGTLELWEGRVGGKVRCDLKVPNVPR
jgi:hypothetical protein